MHNEEFLSFISRLRMRALKVTVKSMALVAFILITHHRLTVSRHGNNKIEASDANGMSGNGEATIKSPFAMSKEDGEEAAQNSIKPRDSLSDHVSEGRETFIVEMQTKLEDILRKLLGKSRDGILIDLPAHSNKGDSAIAVGEVNTLSRLGMTLHYALQTGAPLDKNLVAGSNDTVVLSHGGGNIGTWHNADHRRAKALHVFRASKFIVLAQSAHFYTTESLSYCQEHYNKHPDMTIMLRDENSFKQISRDFSGVTSVLTPDMAWGIGRVKRFYAPSLDIIWINRGDKERAGKHKPIFPSSISHLVTDWLQFKSPKGNHIVEKNYMMTYNGLLFLQRGRVVVTDRLHGHIMAAILNIPTVILDNDIHKLTNFYNTWTKPLDNVMLAYNVEDAVQKALVLLNRVKTLQKAPGF